MSLKENYPLIAATLNPIVRAPIPVSEQGLTRFCSCKGRAYCVLHFLALPLRLLAYLGKVVLQIINIFKNLLAILTFNKPCCSLKKCFKSFADILGGVLLMPFALVLNQTKSFAGAFFHPGAYLGYRPGETLHSPWKEQTVAFYHHKD